MRQCRWQLRSAMPAPSIRDLAVATFINFGAEENAAHCGKGKRFAWPFLKWKFTPPSLILAWM